MSTLRTQCDANQRTDRRRFEPLRSGSERARLAGSVTASIAVALSLTAAAFGQAIAQRRAPIPTPPETRLAWYQEHLAMERSTRFAGLPWQWIGPTNTGGRATDIAVVEPRGESYTMYVATASGGVWKTTNEGVTWAPVFDDYLTSSIGDMAIAPSNADIVWIGTGEANIFRSSHAGAGMYKSTDAGETWTHMGLAGTLTIARILVHPTNPDIVYVAASGHEWTDNEERGVYKTTNGGQTWQKVHYLNAQTGAIDLVMHPTDPNTLYAATWERVRLKWNDPRNTPGTNGSGIWKTTDGGSTWTAINNGLPPAANRGRIGIDIARSSPNTLYAFVDDYDVTRQASAGEMNAYGLPMQDVIRGATVYRTDNAGGSWRKVSQDNSYMEGLSGTYGWVFGQMRVDPTDPDRIYLLGLGLNVSEDGGANFRRLTGMHGDHHALWIDPANPDFLLNGNDGGAYVSYDGGENWRDFTNQIPAVQFFNVGHDMDAPFHVFGSVQDHGSRRGMVDLRGGREAIPAVEFENAPGGEGSTHAIDPTDPNVVYSAGFYGRIERSNLATGEDVTLVPQPAPGEPRLRGQWLAPFIISPHNPRIIYHGMNRLFRSWDRGDSWEAISADLTYNDPQSMGDVEYQTIFAIAESPLRFGLIYAGTDDGRVHVTRDGGETWTEITDGLVEGKFSAEIVASRYDEATVYVAQNGKREDDFAPYVWKSTDYGETWTDIGAGIPLGTVNVVKEDPKNPNVLYAGTDIGVYVTVDGGATWQALPNGLPSVFAHDLIIHPRDDIMVVATHGRGMYALDVRPIQRLTAEAMASPAAVLDQDPIPSPLLGSVPAPSIYYWVAQAGQVTITVRDNAGTAVAEIQDDASAGVNVAVWNTGGGGRGRGGRGGGGFGRGGRGGRGAITAGAIYRLELRAGAASANGTISVEG